MPVKRIDASRIDDSGHSNSNALEAPYGKKPLPVNRDCSAKPINFKRILRTVYGAQLASLSKSCINIDMAQTLTELTALLATVDEAIAKLMSGDRVIRISHGDRMAEYGQAKLGDLQDYKTTLIAEINALNSRPRHFRISTSKGV